MCGPGELNCMNSSTAPRGWCEVCTRAWWGAWIFACMKLENESTAAGKQWIWKGN